MGQYQGFCDNRWLEKCSRVVMPQNRFQALTVSGSDGWGEDARSVLRSRQKVLKTGCVNSTETAVNDKQNLDTCVLEFTRRDTFASPAVLKLQLERPR